MTLTYAFDPKVMDITEAMILKFKTLVCDPENMTLNHGSKAKTRSMPKCLHPVNFIRRCFLTAAQFQTDLNSPCYILCMQWWGHKVHTWIPRVHTPYV